MFNQKCTLYTFEVGKSLEIPKYEYLRTKDHILNKKNDLLETKGYILGENKFQAKVTFQLGAFSYISPVMTMGASHRITPKPSSTHTTKINLIRSKLFIIKKLHNFNSFNFHFKPFSF